MSSSEANSGEVFDLRRIRRLVELMNEHDLAEIDLREAGVRIRLRKRYEQPAGLPAAVQVPPVAPPAERPHLPPAEPPPADEHIEVIRSIMVGTFFAAPNPDAPPFVKVGDHVGPDTIVCIIEAMKVFNEIPAGVSGRIVAVLVQNGDPVEYGQPLFKVDTR
jgi:acetyl-CoA carboxylase biotin carboxyl carrier protein